MAFNDNPYPRFNERWNSRVNDIDNEIEGWWKSTDAARAGDSIGDSLAQGGRTMAAGADAAGDRLARGADRLGDNIARGADRAGDALASTAGRGPAVDGNEGFLDRTGDSIGNWWQGVKSKVADWFDGDDIDEPTRAEYRKALNDDEFMRGRFEERRTELRNQGRLGDF